MMDFHLIVGFDWAAGNMDKSVDKHCVLPSDSEQIFFNEPLLLAADLKHSVKEQRFHALGCTDEGRLLHITFTLRQDETLIRVISARDMNRKERANYEQSA